MKDDFVDKNANNQSTNIYNCTLLSSILRKVRGKKINLGLNLPSYKIKNKKNGSF